uniref:Uncharacterized protein n=1 Tax=Rhizophora mucronata TaxID=61149 RepID=A0A2P2QM13_RHIMU
MAHAATPSSKNYDCVL